MNADKRFEDILVTPKLILRWIREGDVYVNRLGKDEMESCKRQVDEALAQPEHPLDKKAANARELGLDYEPEQVITPISPDQYERFCGTCGACTGKPWVGLTDDEINDFDKKLRDNGDYCSLHFAWGISAKLKRKNGGSI